MASEDRKTRQVKALALDALKRITIRNSLSERSRITGKGDALSRLNRFLASHLGWAHARDTLAKPSHVPTESFNGTGVFRLFHQTEDGAPIDARPNLGCHGVEK